MAFTREHMVLHQLRERGIKDERVLAAMRELDRSIFISPDLSDHAYDDAPLPIGQGQTISQPYIVAYMAEKLKLKASYKVLEIGTGCGYNAAVISFLVHSVYSIEINRLLGSKAQQNLDRAGINNVLVRITNGYLGWPEEAPFDAIVLTAAPASIPQPLIKQLKTGGRLVAPVGNMNQRLILLEKDYNGKITTSNLLPVSFVPMRGESIY